MIIDVDKFYNTSNWKQYVPLEAFTELTKHVAETHLKDTTIKNLLSITYSVDDYGENPVYVEYLDENDQKHLVKLKPAIHEELDKILKEYAKIAYVDQKVSELNTKIEAGDNKTLADSKHYTDEVKNILTININESKEAAINISKQYTNDRETAIRNDFNTRLEEYETKSDASIDHNKLSEVPVGKKQPYISWFPNTDSNYIRMVEDGDDIRFHIQDSRINDERVGYLSATKPSSFATTERVSAGDNQTLNASKAYTNTQLENYETKSDASIDHDKLSEVAVGHKLPFIHWYPDTDSNYIRMVEDGDEIRFHINNSTNNEESIGYLSSRNPANFVTNTDLEPLTSKLSNIWASHKAPFIYWLPNIDVNTMKLQNTENDVKVTLNDSDVVYWSKNPTVTRAQVEAIVQEQIAELKANNEKLNKIIQNLTNSGAWNPNTNDFNAGRNIATGNINFFGGSQDGASFIRTNNGRTENDVVAGI